MKTITIDILNDKALTILRELEQLKIIRLRREKDEPNKPASINLVAKYKGAMSKQPLSEIAQQLNALRNG